MKLIATAIFAMLLGFVGASAMTTQASAHPGHDHTAVTVAAKTTSEVMYNYEAQNGDSYSLIARKAVQTYGAKYKVVLTEGQILFAETHLTLDANSPQLTVGQKVTMKESAIKSWVEKAQKLTASQKAAWQSYAQFADFNTNNVGEAR